MTSKSSVMVKNDLIDHIAEVSGLSKADVKKFSDAMYDVVLDAMRKGSPVRLFNICTVSSVSAPAKSARNPRTNEIIKVPAKQRLKFKASATLKTDVNA